MTNYSDNPSMDEILRRIKRALAEREQRAEQERTEASSVVSISNADSTGPSLNKGAAQDIIIKPNVKPENSGIFVLTKEMKVNSMAKVADADFQQLCFNLSDKMSKDLAMAYMGPKMEDWLLNNFWEIVAKSKKGIF